MKKNISIILLGTAFIFLNGCKETFSPNGKYEEKMVVYAVLSARSDTQFVRVYSTYKPQANILSVKEDTPITDAQVQIRQGSTVFTFRDTTLPRLDSTRYHSAIASFVHYGMHLEYGKQYDLTVTSPTHGTATASTISVREGELTITKRNALLFPRSEEKILVDVDLGLNCYAYFVRFLLNYEIQVNGVWKQNSVEVPVSVTSTGNSVDKLYAKPIFCANSNIKSVGFPFYSNAYIEILSELKTTYGDSIRYKKANFILLQFDQNVYAYYSVVNGFPGSSTIRLDEPNYTNISGGLGVFGMTTENILSIDLPSTIPF